MFYLWEALACLVFVIKCLIVVILMFDLYVLWRNMLNGDCLAHFVSNSRFNSRPFMRVSPA